MSYPGDRKGLFSHKYWLVITVLRNAIFGRSYLAILSVQSGLAQRIPDGNICMVTKNLYLRGLTEHMHQLPLSCSVLSQGFSVGGAEPALWRVA